MTQVPAPLEWHPAYRDKTWLLDWLEGRGEYAHLHVLMIPVDRPPWSFAVEFGPDSPTPQPLTLERRRCAGLAPYVGEPFHYEWWAGVDNLGRVIAGDSRIVHEKTKGAGRG